jgi:hypothetical protein
MLVGWSVGWSVRLSVCPHITLKTGYVAIASRLGFGNNLVFFMAGVLLLLGLFTIQLTTKRLEIKFFIAGIFL